MQWPDGRRAFAHGKFMADASVVKWMYDALPAGSYASTSSGGDTWNWVTSSPTPKSGTKAHKTTAGTGLKEHSFVGASSPMEVGTGDTLFAYVWVEPGTQEIMLHWFDGTSWDHRAYWGSNNIGYGTTGTPSRISMSDTVPAAGQWVRLEIPAAKVGLEGKKVYGMAFSTYNGGATWDLTGRAKAGATLP